MGNREEGMGNGEWEMGNLELGMGNWELGNCPNDCGYSYKIKNLNQLIKLKPFKLIILEISYKKKWAHFFHHINITMNEIIFSCTSKYF